MPVTAWRGSSRYSQSCPAPPLDPSRNSFESLSTAMNERFILLAIVAIATAVPSSETGFDPSYPPEEARDRNFPYGPGPPSLLSALSGFHSKSLFVRRLCIGAQGA